MDRLRSLHVKKDSELLEEAVKEFEDKLKDFFYVVPTSQLLDMESKQLACCPSKLKLGAFDTEEKEAHFLKCHNYGDINKDDVCKEVKTHIQSLCENAFRNKSSFSLIRILNVCEAETTNKLAAHVDCSITDEEELRSVVGDSIAYMICNYWGHEVCVVCPSHYPGLLL